MNRAQQRCQRLQQLAAAKHQPNRRPPPLTSTEIAKRYAAQQDAERKG